MHYIVQLVHSAIRLTCLNAMFTCYFLCTEEAVAKYGKDQIKLYTSSFTPMYHAVTERKSPCKMKMIVLLPTEKVRRFVSSSTSTVVDSAISDCSYMYGHIIV